jgi:ribonuclease R
LDARRIEFSLVKPNSDRNGVAGVGASDRFSQVDQGRGNKTGRHPGAKKSSSRSHSSSRANPNSSATQAGVRGSRGAAGDASGGLSSPPVKSAGAAKKKTTAAKAGKKPKKASNAKSKGHELSIRKGRR